jgi:putative aldouronate transport system substrate-binding protein
MKKFSIMIVVLLILFIGNVFGAGGTQAGGESQTGRGPVKLTVAMEESLRIKDFETNIQTGIIEKRANVDLDFVLFPAVDYLNKLNLMVMAGGKELPDIITISMGARSRFTDMMVYQWAREGAIIPLTKYYKDPKFSPGIQEGIKRTGVDFTPMITSPDGEIYGIPAYSQAVSNEYPNKFWYYKPWADKLGLKIPETTEEFRNFLKAAVVSDPNGNGRPDEIGFTGSFRLGDYYFGWFNYLMNPFVYAGDANFMTVENGKVGAAYNTPEWKEGLKYIRSLFAENLIPSETLTQDTNQIRTLLNAQETRVFSFNRSSPSDINDNNPAAVGYIAGPPLKGPKGRRYAAYYPSVPVISFMVSANCKNPDAAFRAGDEMTREDISIITRWGEEHVDWDYAENVADLSNYVSSAERYPIKIIVYNDMRFWGGSLVFNSSWRESGPFIRQYDIVNGRGITLQDNAGRMGNLYRGISMYSDGGYAPKEVIPKLIYNEEENDAVKDILVTLNTYVIETTSKFLNGNQDIDSAWNAYLNELNTIGLPKALPYIQRAYDRMYKK